MTSAELKAAIRAFIYDKDAYTSNGAANVVHAMDLLIDELDGAGGSGGGSQGIDDVLAEAQALTANRTINLNTRSISLIQGSNVFRFDGAQRTLFIGVESDNGAVQGIDASGVDIDGGGMTVQGGTASGIGIGGAVQVVGGKSDGSGKGGDVDFRGGDNEGAGDGGDIVINVGISGGGGNPGTVNIFGNVGVGTTPDKLFVVSNGSDDLIGINKDNFSSKIAASDGTALSQMSFNADLAGNDVSFNLTATDGANQVDIEADAQAETLIYTAAKHEFNGNVKLLVTSVPGAANATGETGQFSWDANFMYMCIAPDTWKRVAIATW